jgi:sulfur carrier protein
MTIVLNGQERDLPDGATVAELLERFGLPSAGTAVAVDGAVVPRAGHAATVLTDGAVVEVLTAVQGG